MQLNSIYYFIHTSTPTLLLQRLREALSFWIYFVHFRRLTMTMTIPTATVVHRQEFHYATRSWNEPFETWYTRLKSLAEPCLFGDSHEAFLLNKLVVDIRDDGSDNCYMTEQGWSIKSFEIRVKADLECDANADSYVEPVCIADVKDESLDMTDFAQANNSDVKESFIITFHDTKIAAEENCAKTTDRAPTIRKKRRKIPHNYGAIRLKSDESLTDVKNDKHISTEAFTRAKKKRTRRFCLWQNPGAFYCEHCPEKKFTFKCKFIHFMYHIIIEVQLLFSDCGPRAVCLTLIGR